MKLLAISLLVSLTCISFCGQQESHESAKTNQPNEAATTAKKSVAADGLFLNDFDDAIKKANETGKPIFIYVFDSV